MSRRAESGAPIPLNPMPVAVAVSSPWPQPPDRKQALSACTRREGCGEDHRRRHAGGVARLFMGGFLGVPAGSGFDAKRAHGLARPAPRQSRRASKPGG